MSGKNSDSDYQKGSRSVAEDEVFDPKDSLINLIEFLNNQSPRVFEEPQQQTDKKEAVAHIRSSEDVLDKQLGSNQQTLEIPEIFKKRFGVAQKLLTGSDTLKTQRINSECIRLISVERFDEMDYEHAELKQKHSFIISRHENIYNFPLEQYFLRVINSLDQTMKHHSEEDIIQIENDIFHKDSFLATYLQSYEDRKLGQFLILCNESIDIQKYSLANIIYVSALRLLKEEDFANFKPYLNDQDLYEYLLADSEMLQESCSIFISTLIKNLLRASGFSKYEPNSHHEVERVPYNNFHENTGSTMIIKENSQNPSDKNQKGSASESLKPVSDIDNQPTDCSYEDLSLSIKVSLNDPEAKELQQTNFSGTSVTMDFKETGSDENIKEIIYFNEEEYEEIKEKVLTRENDNFYSFPVLRPMFELRLHEVCKYISQNFQNKLKKIKTNEVKKKFKNSTDVLELLEKNYITLKFLSTVRYLNIAKKINPKITFKEAYLLLTTCTPNCPDDSSPKENNLEYLARIIGKDFKNISKFGSFISFLNHINSYPRNFLANVLEKIPLVLDQLQHTSYSLNIEKFDDMLEAIETYMEHEDYLDSTKELKKSLKSIHFIETIETNYKFPIIEQSEYLFGKIKNMSFFEKQNTTNDGCDGLKGDNKKTHQKMPSENRIMGDFKKNTDVSPPKQSMMKISTNLQQNYPSSNFYLDYIESQHIETKNMNNDEISKDENLNEEATNYQVRTLRKNDTNEQVEEANENQKRLLLLIENKNPETFTDIMLGEYCCSVKHYITKKDINLCAQNSIEFDKALAERTNIMDYIILMKDKLDFIRFHMLLAEILDSGRIRHLPYYDIMITIMQKLNYSPDNNSDSIKKLKSKLKTYKLSLPDPKESICAMDQCLRIIQKFTNYLVKFLKKPSTREEKSHKITADKPKKKEQLICQSYRIIQIVILKQFHSYCSQNESNLAFHTLTTAMYRQYERYIDCNEFFASLVYHTQRIYYLILKVFDKYTKEVVKDDELLSFVLSIDPTDETKHPICLKWSSTEELPLSENLDIRSMKPNNGDQSGTSKSQNFYQFCHISTKDYYLYLQEIMQENPINNSIRKIILMDLKERGFLQKFLQKNCLKIDIFTFFFCLIPMKLSSGYNFQELLFVVLEHYCGERDQQENSSYCEDRLKEFGIEALQKKTSESPNYTLISVVNEINQKITSQFYANYLGEKLNSLSCCTISVPNTKIDLILDIKVEAFRLLITSVRLYQDVEPTNEKISQHIEDTYLRILAMVIDCINVPFYRYQDKDISEVKKVMLANFKTFNFESVVKSYLDVEESRVKNQNKISEGFSGVKLKLFYTYLKNSSSANGISFEISDKIFDLFPAPVLDFLDRNKNDIDPTIFYAVILPHVFQSDFNYIDVMTTVLSRLFPESTEEMDEERIMNVQKFLEANGINSKPKHFKTSGFIQLLNHLKWSYKHLQSNHISMLEDQDTSCAVGFSGNTKEVQKKLMKQYEVLKPALQYVISLIKLNMHILIQDPDHYDFEKYNLSLKKVLDQVIDAYNYIDRNDKSFNKIISMINDSLLLVRKEKSDWKQELKDQEEKKINQLDDSKILALPFSNISCKEFLIFVNYYSTNLSNSLRSNTEKKDQLPSHCDIFFNFTKTNSVHIDVLMFLSAIKLFLSIYQIQGGDWFFVILVKKYFKGISMKSYDESTFMRFLNKCSNMNIDIKPLLHSNNVGQDIEKIISQFTTNCDQEFKKKLVSQALKSLDLFKDPSLNDEQKITLFYDNEYKLLDDYLVNLNKLQEEIKADDSKIVNMISRNIIKLFQRVFVSRNKFQSTLIPFSETAAFRKMKITRRPDIPESPKEASTENKKLLLQSIKAKLEKIQIAAIAPVPKNETQRHKIVTKVARSETSQPPNIDFVIKGSSEETMLPKNINYNLDIKSLETKLLFPPVIVTNKITYGEKEKVEASGADFVKPMTVVGNFIKCFNNYTNLGDIYFGTELDTKYTEERDRYMGDLQNHFLHLLRLQKDQRPILKKIFIVDEALETIEKHRLDDFINFKRDFTVAIRKVDKKLICVVRYCDKEEVKNNQSEEFKKKLEVIFTSPVLKEIKAKLRPRCVNKEITDRIMKMNLRASGVQNESAIQVSQLNAAIQLRLAKEISRKNVPQTTISPSEEEKDPADVATSKKTSFVGHDSPSDEAEREILIRASEENSRKSSQRKRKKTKHAGGGGWREHSLGSQSMLEPEGESIPESELRNIRANSRDKKKRRSTHRSHRKEHSLHQSHDGESEAPTNRDRRKKEENRSKTTKQNPIRITLKISEILDPKIDIEQSELYVEDFSRAKMKLVDIEPGNFLIASTKSDYLIVIKLNEHEYTKKRIFVEEENYRLEGRSKKFANMVGLLKHYCKNEFSAIKRSL